MTSAFADAGAFRQEADSLGPVEVPVQAYYGAQTARAIRNFEISSTKLSDFPDLLKALGYVKKAAVRANLAFDLIDPGIADAIEHACDELIAGHHAAEFPVDVFQGGAGTSTNMNANEVIANIALEKLGLQKADYERVHPNNHVNLSQSTNDVYPTAIRLAILLRYKKLVAAVTQLADAFEERAKAFAPVLKLGRTQLQDAVPMTLGQEFHAFASTLREDVLRLKEAAALFLEVNLGGTAIGTGINTRPGYSQSAVQELAQLTGLPMVPAADLVEACWDTGAFVQFSGTTKRLATKLSKICNDLRLLSSGPRGGLNEINLPPMQPGSSIMPGKVNPVIPEVVNQVAFQVIGTDLTITLAAEAGQLQLNVMEPVICFNILNNLSLLTNAANTLRVHCVVGITANEADCARHLNAGAAVATALTPIIGYDRAATLAKQVLTTGRSVRDLLGEIPDLSEDLANQVTDPERLTRPI
ncbi:aspartate ammonia-lyase [Pseudooceanicola onchidii]|uniref:aspartate ammonia-lyase n=1 Tax=Pseudooceanicola onchidii TaxID=2562279 RepID=UPI0010AB143E|nr:aspartate ammonia-lyase [Pseudooceanicola onchidii]